LAICKKVKCAPSLYIKISSARYIPQRKDFTQVYSK
jgi:hypothetical protein